MVTLPEIRRVYMKSSFPIKTFLLVSHGIINSNRMHHNYRPLCRNHGLGLSMLLCVNLRLGTEISYKDSLLA